MILDITIMPMKYLLVVFNPVVAVIYFYFGFMEFRQFIHNKNKFNLNLGLFYLIMSIGLSINIIMAVNFTKFTEEQYIVLGRICACIFLMAQWAIIYFLLGVNYGYKGILKLTKITLLAFMGVTIYLWAKIGEIKLITVEDHQYITWNLELGLFSLAYLLIIFVCMISLSIKIYKKLLNPLIKRRFIMLSIGINLIVLCLTTTTLMNINIINRNLGAIILTLILIIFSPLIYAGTKKGLIS